MSKKPENTPAFACAAENGYQEGMLLRDYFAAAALPGVLASLSYTKGDDGEPIKNVDGVAKLAYGQADAMLRARGQS